MSPPLEEALVVVLLVGSALRRCGIPYAVGGSVASSILGEPRSTLDLDVAVELAQSQIAPLAGALGGDFYFDAEAAGDALRAGVSFNAIHLPTNIKIDFFPARSDFDRRQTSRRQQVQLVQTGETVYICTAEDMVLRKLLWYRLGQEISDRQWRDVLGILRARGQMLDGPYLAEQAEALGIADLLARALADAQH